MRAIHVFKYFEQNAKENKPNFFLIDVCLWSTISAAFNKRKS